MKEKVVGEFIQYLDSNNNKYELSKEYPFIRYSGEIRNFIKFWLNSKYTDFKYLSKSEKYNQEVLVKTLNEEEVRGNITFILRGERFADGLIMDNLERLKELLIKFNN